MSDLVSIIMPNYNSARFIEESINSVINQTYNNWELIICDDNSTDNSKDIAKNYESGDQRIKVIKINLKKGLLVQEIHVLNFHLKYSFP